MDTFIDRARAAFLGLALGDAFGRPLEFIGLPAVRTAPVDVRPGTFRWTDDTHMALYLGRAVLDVGAAPVNEDRFGRAVGERFSEWRDDPATPGTAPGNTCLSGVARWRKTRDWRTSGVPGSDGCGAVMRICPLALAFEGDDLTKAARVSAAITHAHPNAIESAVAASHLLRWTLETGRFDADLVRRAMEGLRGPWSQGGGSTAKALEAAIAEGARGGEWLDERAIPDGDGGWRSPSALGLAVAAALRWGDDFALAVEKAARIGGDSDSVACLTGMFLGAAGGTRVLPGTWLSALHERDTIDALATRLARLSQRSAPAREGTREDVWVAVADLHGHLDHFRALLKHLDAEYGSSYRLCTLGDYVDNGPQIPELLDFLIELKEARGDRFVPILGNHDFALLRSLGWPDGTPNETWYGRWSGRYWNAGGETPYHYARRAKQPAPNSAADFARLLPPAHPHRQFLEALPWVHCTEEFLFVHAGMYRGSLAPQLEELAARKIPVPGPGDEPWLVPQQLRDKSLSKVEDPTWDRVVVSAHNKHLGGPRFERPRRICLSGEVDATQVLHAVVLPERVWISVDRRLKVRTERGNPVERRA